MTAPAILGNADTTMATRVEAFLAQFGPDRAEALHLALRDVAARARQHLALLAELAWLAHEEQIWSKVRGPDGKPFASPEQFFEQTLGLGAWRSIWRYVTVGRVIAAAPNGERESLRALVAEAGITKVAIVAPVLETADDDARRTWLERTRALDVEALQAAVSDARGTGRGRGEGDRVERYLLAVAPDMEARATMERLFWLGRRLDKGRTAISILVAAAQEALASWEPEAAR